MRYFKWQSDDNCFIFEKMVGDVTADLIEVSDEYIVDLSVKDNLAIISDCRDASFRKMSLGQGWDLGMNFTKLIPQNLHVELALITNPSRKEDSEIISKYAAAADTSRFTTAKTFHLMNEAYDWLNISSLISDELEKELQAWEKKLAEE